MGIGVLVVEDESRVAAVIRLVLERRGHQVTVAGSIAEAQLALAAAEPDAVIADFILPDGDGLSFALAARATHGVAVLLMSGLQHLPGADGIAVLAKPFTPDQLEGALAAALAGARADTGP